MKVLAGSRWSRKNGSAAALAAGACLLAFGLAGCNKLKARDLLNQGTSQYKDGKYDKAAEDFKKAKELDPTLLNARIYLATSYASQYIPGAASPENMRMAQAAIDEFNDVLSTDPNNLTAMDWIGSLLYSMAASPFTPAKFEEAKSYNLKHIAIKPTDPEPYYWIGVIDWTLAYHANAELRVKYNQDNPKKQIRDDDPLPPALRAQYVKEYGEMIDEGITDANKAIELRPDYDDAMAYLNLLLRRKADEVDSMDERASLIKQAGDLMDKVKEIKQKKMEAASKS